MSERKGSIRCAAARLAGLVLVLCAGPATAQEVQPLTPDSDPAAFYGALLSRLGGRIDCLELTLGGTRVSRRADEKGYAREVTFFRADWPMTIRRIAVHSREPMSAAALEGGASDTLILPLVVRIGEVVYHAPIMGFRQYWWESDASTPPMSPPAPTPTPTPTSLPETGPRMEYRIAEIRIDRFAIEDGSFEYEKTFRSGTGEEYREPFNLRDIALEVRNLALTPYDGATDLAPLTLTARLESTASPPTILSASGYLFPEYDALSFKINGDAETIHLASMQPLIPYAADIYLDEGTALMDFTAVCRQNQLELVSTVDFFNVRTSTSGQGFNPFRRVSRKAVERVDRKTIDYTVHYTIGSGKDFGDAYGKALMDAIGKEFGGKLAATFTVQAPVVLGETVFGLFTWPFRTTKKGPRGAHDEDTNGGRHPGRSH